MTNMVKFHSTTGQCANSYSELNKGLFKKRKYICSKLVSTESRTVSNRKCMGKFENSHFGG